MKNNLYKGGTPMQKIVIESLPEAFAVVKDFGLSGAKEKVFNRRYRSKNA